MDFKVLAERIAFTNIEAARRRKKRKDEEEEGPKPKHKRERVSQPKVDFVSPKTEYSAHIDLSITVNFEGDVAKDILEKKIQNELIAAIQNGMTVVAEEFDLQSTTARVKPIKMELAINDQAAVEDDIESTEIEEQ
jgi:hypothetical protein